MYARKHRKNAAALLEIIPESHLDHGLTPAHIDFIKEKFADKTGFFIETVQLPAKLTSLQDALYGPLVGDKPVAESAVHYAVRGIRPGESRMVDKPMRETRYVTVIAGPHDGKPLVLYTAFGGKLTPKEPFDPTLNPAQKAESEAFWSQHALATGKQASKRANSSNRKTTQDFTHLSDAELEARIITASQGMQYWRGYNPSFYDMAEKEWDALTAEKKRRGGSKASRDNGAKRANLSDYDNRRLVEVDERLFESASRVFEAGNELGYLARPSSATPEEVQSLTTARDLIKTAVSNIDEARYGLPMRKLERSNSSGLAAEKKRRARPNTTVHAHDLDCPSCGAPAGYYCNRPNGTAQKTPHKARHPRKRDNATDAEPYYHYEMEGYGEFPLDMLRYDNARFASVNDERIARNPNLGWTPKPFSNGELPIESGARVVGIISRQEPTLARWRSFGWELYRMYNSTGAPAYPYDGEGVTPKPWITGYKTRDNATDDQTCATCHAYDVPADARECPHCGGTALTSDVRAVRRGPRTGTPQLAGAPSSRSGLLKDPVLQSLWAQIESSLPAKPMSSSAPRGRPKLTLVKRNNKRGARRNPDAFGEHTYVYTNPEKVRAILAVIIPAIKDYDGNPEWLDEGSPEWHQYLVRKAQTYAALARATEVVITPRGYSAWIRVFDPSYKYSFQGFLEAAAPLVHQYTPDKLEN